MQSFEKVEGSLVISTRSTNQDIVKFSGDLCYPEEIKRNISSYQIIQRYCYLKCRTFSKILSNKGDAEKYHQDYYFKIAYKADSNFQACKTMLYFISEKSW